MIALQLNLGNHLESYVKKQIESGSYKTVNELLSESVSLLEREEDRDLNNIRQALIDGENSGESQHFDNEAFIVEMKLKYANRAI
jgi:antitoxin ParD1/3/4